MKTKKVTIDVSTNKYSVDVPINCPYCNAFIEPHFVKCVTNDFNNSRLYLSTFRANCCNKLFFTVHEKPNNTSNFILLFSYPQITLESLPDSIKEISPRFIELYKQSNFAELNGHLELAGTGYRNALEVLIKDFAINELKKPEDEVKKKSLYEAIGNYLPNERLMNTADVVRILGNDLTHYERKYNDLDFNILKQYITIFVNQINAEYLITHPPVEANRP